VPARLREYRLRLRDQRRERRGRANDTDPLDGDGDSSEPDWKDQLIERLLAMPPDAFEKLARRLLREAGFVSARVTGRSGDGGIDGIGVYRLSLVSFPAFFQCKRYRGSVRASARSLSTRVAAVRARPFSTAYGESRYSIGAGRVAWANGEILRAPPPALASSRPSLSGSGRPRGCSGAWIRCTRARDRGRRCRAEASSHWLLYARTLPRHRGARIPCSTISRRCASVGRGGTKASNYAPLTTFHLRAAPGRSRVLRYPTNCVDATYPSGRRGEKMRCLRSSLNG